MSTLKKSDCKAGALVIINDYKIPSIQSRGSITSYLPVVAFENLFYGVKKNGPYARENVVLELIEEPQIYDADCIIYVKFKAINSDVVYAAEWNHFCKKTTLIPANFSEVQL
jgi:hypothetical protein